MATNQSPNSKRPQQLPILTPWRDTDSVWQLHAILNEHNYGIFNHSADLWMQMQTDDRISAVLETRVAGLMGADLGFVPAMDKVKARKVAELMGGTDKTQDDGLWRRIVSVTNAKELLRWKIGLGVAFGPVVWKAVDGKWIPRVLAWNPKYLRFDWGDRRFKVITANGAEITMPNTDEEPRSDGNWFFWGGEGSWMHGLVRSLGMKFIDRSWNERDRARRSEKYGNAIVEGQHPADAKPADVDEWRLQLANLGAEPTIMTPQRDPKMGASYGLKIHEVKGEGWQIFNDTQKVIDDAIAIRMIGQNLTTSVDSGALASTKVHEVIRGDIKKDDAEIFPCLREQVLCWHSHYNYGEAGLAPYPNPQIESASDPESEAMTAKLIGEAITLLRQSPLFDEETFIEAHGLPLLDPDDVPPPVATVPGAPGAPGGSDERQPGRTPPEGKTPATRAALVALKASPAVVRRRQFYAESRMARARQLAGKALEPELEALLAEIRGAKSLEDIHAIVLRVARKPGASVAEIAKLTERLNVLANLEGRKDALVAALGPKR